MTVNEVLTRHLFLSKVLLATNSKELGKELKIKIMNSRIQYNKVRKQYETDVLDCLKMLMTLEFIDLRDNKNRTEDQEKQLEGLIENINSEIELFITLKSLEETTCTPLQLTQEEFEEIIEVNSNNNVVLNNNMQLTASDFLELIYNLFVF